MDCPDDFADHHHRQLCRETKRKFEDYMFEDDQYSKGSLFIGSKVVDCIAAADSNSYSSHFTKRREIESGVVGPSGVSDESMEAGNSEIEVRKDQRLYLFVRMMDGKSLSFFVSSDDTVLSLHETIESVTCVPVKDQRLIYGGRQLEVGRKLSDYSIGKESTLNLVGRLCSGRNPEVWKLVEDMINSAIRLFRGGGVNSDADMKALMSRYLKWVCEDGENLGLSNLRILTSLSAVEALTMLRLSPVESTRITGSNVIKQFLCKTHMFPQRLHTYAATIVLEFCKHFEKTEPRDSLYEISWRTLGSLVGGGDAVVRDVYDWTRNSVSVQEIFPYVIEISARLSEDMMKSTRAVVSEWPLLSHVSDFTSFLCPILTLIMERVTEEGPISLPMEDNGINRQFFWEEIKYLHLILKELNRTMDLCLQRVERCLNCEDATKCKYPNIGFQYLSILKELDSISKIYEDESDNLWEMLGRRRIALCALITRCAIRGEDNNWLLEHKDVLDFDSRRHLTLMMLPEVREDYSELHEMLIDRSHLLAESFEYISHADPKALRAGLFMEFKNEEATGPGVLREWFLLMCKEMFDPQNALFIENANDLRRFYISPASKVDPLHLKYFRVCGRVIALALMYKVQVGVVFDRVFFMQLAGLVVQLEDIKDTDPTLYRSCKRILGMDADLIDSDALGLTFVREYEELGSRKIVELIPGGEHVKVDSRNREEFVDALVRSRFVGATSRQMDCFADGFGDILLNSSLRSLFFRSLELEDFDRMLRGSESDISVIDWKAHTQYKGYMDTDYQIVWFWKIVEEMSVEQRRQLLFFWASIKYLPVEGFSSLSSPLYILQSAGTASHLPTSHTCFFQICLPRYDSLEIMRDRLAIVTQDHVGTSFGTV